jgi:hypothetical protein
MVRCERTVAIEDSLLAGAISLAMAIVFPPAGDKALAVPRLPGLRVSRYAGFRELPSYRHVLATSRPSREDTVINVTPPSARFSSGSRPIGERRPSSSVRYNAWNWPCDRFGD